MYPASDILVILHSGNCLGSVLPSRKNTAMSNEVERSEKTVDNSEVLAETIFTGHAKPPSQH
jgi:hypothetical protein